MKPPLHFQRFQLPFVGVRLQALNAQREVLKGVVASGFIRRLAGRLYLYTCWHVVTGFDLYDVRVGLNLPNRRYLELTLQTAEQRNPSTQVVGGTQTVTVPLYDDGPQQPSTPLWEQDNQHIPHPDLNAVRLYVPFWHDVVRIELPPDLALSDLQVIDEQRLFKGNIASLSPGDKCMVVGYPYGFSAFGPQQPTPVALTRFVASDRIAERHQQLLLEGIAAPGMSGGPVFVERDDELLLFGVYTGSIYPDFALNSNEKVTALGTVANLSMHLWDHLQLVRGPSEPVSQSGG